MPTRVILLSGPVGSGKSTLAQALCDRYGHIRIRTHDLIQQHMQVTPSRGSYQRGGEALDRRTGGQWVADAVSRLALQHPSEAVLIVDAVRIKGQIDAVRRAFGHRVVHVHLTAPVEELERRYLARKSPIAEFASYGALRSNPTERAIERLSAHADICVDTVECSFAGVVVRVAARLGLYRNSSERLVDVLVGGQYGSEGKGNVAAYLANEYEVLVRVGGPNAGHRVYEQNGAFTFHLLPSGTRRNVDADVVVGPGAVLSLPVLREEIGKCECSSRLRIDPQAMIIEPQDVRREKKLTAAISSTGQGVGLATARKVLRTNASPRVRLARDIGDLKPYLRETRMVLERAFASGKRVFVEGTQGTGLSLHHGSYPYVTSRDTTVAGCLAEAGIAPGRMRKAIMVCRTYPIRVQNPSAGTSGPMEREITLAEIARRSGIDLQELEDTERTSTTHRARRIAEFDWELLRKAASLNGPTDIALTFADYLDRRNRKARRFEQLTEPTIQFVEEVEHVAGAPVSLIATRFHYRAIIDRRAW